jgi:hypothetical protein
MLRAICLALLICPELYAKGVVPVRAVDPTPIPAGRYELCFGDACAGGARYDLIYARGHVFLVIPDTEVCFVGRPQPDGLRLEFRTVFVLMLKPCGDGTLRGQQIFDNWACPVQLSPVVE